MKEVKSLKQEIESLAEKFIKIVEDKEIQVISHFDTDGITSATIMIQTLKKLDKKFSVKIVKSLEGEFIHDLPKNKITLFLDLASGSLNHILEAGLKDVFIIDHHEIAQKIPEGINIINPQLNGKEKMSSSCLTYLFSREINPENKESAKLAILGMIGDVLEKEIDKLDHKILEDGEIKRRRGLLIYPSTRPLNRTLEFCSHPYIPEVTGNVKGVLELLRETNLVPENGKYKSIIELDDQEMQRLTTAIMLRNPKARNREIIGDIFLIKLFNKLEDARELSAMINACSRSGEPETAIQFCMELAKAKKRVESIHARYKQLLISGLKFASETPRIQGNGFVIINAKNRIKDTMIGTIASILSNSSLYEEGTLITGMAYYDDPENQRFSVSATPNQQGVLGKIKVSSRVVGRNGRNAREILSRIIEQLGGEVGGHECAAGCIITQDKEKQFIELLKKNLEIEVVRV
ncbi:MAG: DHH family phosphoesterase [archaeon]